MENGVHSWVQGRDSCLEHLAVYVGQQINEIRSDIEVHNPQTEQALAKQFSKELK
jgi:hypothetical protein